LGHWKDQITKRLVIELEYQPCIQDYYPATMRELRQYMAGTLKVPLSPSLPLALSQDQVYVAAEHTNHSCSYTVALQLLAHLHDTVGMVHRDIKRGNILVYKTPSGST
jgi:serine/threonine protein kinase